MDEEENGGLVEEMMAAAGEIASTGEFRNPYRKQLVNLSRRIKLLVPMLEEIKERKDPISISISISDEEDAVGNLAPLLAPLRSAKELLRFGNQGSKICLVLERDKILKMFQEITTQLEQALSEISYEKLDLSDEVREQVELVHAQFKRAKERVDTPDEELYNDLSSIYNVTDANAADPAILQRLAEQLHLMTLHDLKQESLALQELVVSSGGVDPGVNIEKMSMLLRKIKDFVQTQNPEMGAPADTRVLPSIDEPRVPAVPDDFRCPISLQLMKDPVIVSTGQTYERGCIEKWTKYGHDTCPKTQQKLSSTEVTPNYVLRSLISQWCEANGMDPPERPLWPSEPPSICSAAEHAKVVDLVRKLSSLDLEDQQSAAGELRLLAKRSAENRVCIAAAAAIPQLVSLLSKSDTRIQEHAVTALLNLSICEENKGRIVSCWAVPGIVQVLKKGSMEARENAAATLFSLSVVDENKVTIGASGAIPALASLLSEGSQRGKKDAATALFNLCIYQGNKGKAVRAGVIPTLMRLLTEPGGGMVDEALAILSILSSNSDGKAAIGAAEAVPVLVEIIGNGSPRNRENAAAVLLHLCSGELQQQRLAEVQGLGVVSLLHDLAINGTDRGKRKATHLLERMNRFLEQQKQAEDATQA